MTLADVVAWHPRGIGGDFVACLCCPDSGEELRANIAAFVASREDGELAVDILGHGARLDYRSYEPRWIQVKVGACGQHRWVLDVLVRQWYIGRREIEDLRQEALARDVRHLTEIG